MRLCFGVSCGIARARSFVCDHVRARRGRRGHVVAVAVPWRGRRAPDVVTSLDVAVAPAVFLQPCGGCDTPMDASVCNGLCGVCVVLVCYLTG